MSDDRRTPARAALVEAVQALSAAVAICYAAAWLVAWALYARVELRPEDVGIGPDFLIVRGSMGAAVVIFIVGWFLMPTAFGNWLSLGRQGFLRPFHVLFVVTRLVFFGLCMVALFTVGGLLLKRLDIGVGDGVRWLVAALLALPLVFVEGAVVLRAVRYEAGSPDGPGLGELSPRHVLGATTVWLLVAFGTAFAIGTLLGNKVRENEPVEPIFNIRPVAVFSDIEQYGAASDMSVDTPAAPLACGLKLGQSDGSVFLLSGGHVVSFPVDRVVVVRDLADAGIYCPTTTTSHSSDRNRSNEER